MTPIEYFVIKHIVFKMHINTHNNEENDNSVSISNASPNAEEHKSIDILDYNENDLNLK